MRVLVGFSGGLDSMMTAALLKEAGHTVEGAIVSMHAHTDLFGARDAAEALGIPLHVIDARAAFAQHVVQNFTSEYAAARTPNPCIRCNRYVKIGALADYAAANGFDRFATGHYARVVEHAGRFCVSVARDKKKDQSYVLWMLPQEMLSRMLTPLGDYEKQDVRAMAADRGFAVADKPESQDICFVPDGDYAAFVTHRIGAPVPGEFVTADGRVVGTHKGLLHYTRGQRKRLGIALGEPVFITDMDPDTNRITVAPARELACDGFTCTDPVFSGISPQENGASLACLVQLRYNAPLRPVTAFFDESGVTARFSSPIPVIPTPGQSAVFYDTDGHVLFGALCEK